MFSSKDRSTHLTCGFKVNTSSPEWHKSMTKILKKVKGGDFSLNADEGMAYVSGQGDPNKLLRLMGSMKSKATEMAFLKTSGYHHQHHHHYHHNHHQDHHQDPHYNSYYGQPPSYYGQYPPYYSQSPAVQPYHQQYSYPGIGYNNNCGYY